MTPLMGGYTKLFSSLLDSTIWLQPDGVRLVWITMLAMADRCGEVGAAVPGLAKRAGVSIEVCTQALNIFMSPDQYSRSVEYEGRRIKRIDGGWRLLNYEKYRKLMSLDDMKAKAAQRQARYIAKLRNVAADDDTSVLTSARHNDYIAEADAKAEAFKNQENPPTPPAPVAKTKKGRPRLNKSYVPTSEASQEEVKAWMAHWRVEVDHSEASRFLDHFRSTGVAHLDWGAAWRNWKRRAPEMSRSPKLAFEAKADVGYTPPPRNGAPAWHNEPMISADEHATFAAKLAQAVAKVGT